jgi:hypothetical protein
MGERKRVRGWRIRVPRLAEIGRVTNEVDSFLVIDSDDDTASVAKLIFMCFGEDLRPRHACVGAQERVGILVRAEHGAYRTDAHHETGSGRGKNTAKVVWDRDGVQMEGAIFGVGGVATD